MSERIKEAANQSAAQGTPQPPVKVKHTLRGEAIQWFPGDPRFEERETGLPNCTIVLGGPYEVPGRYMKPGDWILFAPKETGGEPIVRIVDDFTFRNQWERVDIDQQEIYRQETLRWEETFRRLEPERMELEKLAAQIADVVPASEVAKAIELRERLASLSHTIRAQRQPVAYDDNHTQE